MICSPVKSLLFSDAKPVFALLVRGEEEEEWRQKRKGNEENHGSEEGGVFCVETDRTWMNDKEL